MAKAFIILLLASACYGAEVKATGMVRARIIAPEVFEVPTVENLTKDVPYVIVYTEKGATAQVVF